MYINYKTINGIEYGTVMKSVRNGSSVSKADQVYLGRVIDKDKLIFKNREHGLFVYDLSTNSYTPVDANYAEPNIARKNQKPVRSNLIVSFGDMFFLNEYIHKIGFDKAIDAIGYANMDTLYALLAYYILCPLSNCHAEDWWDLTYAKLLYPNAKLASQRISNALADIGSEEAKRNFFKEYTAFLRKAKTENEAAASVENGILIDSSGLPNSSHMHVTAVNNHNGVVSEEIRLIYVVQQKTGLPLFFRYVPGNVIDASTVTRTIAELKANGIDTKFAILDAGYYSGKNADTLLDAKVSFMSRMKSNFSLYKSIVDEHLAGLETRDNLVRFNNRLVYVKRVECKIGQNNDRDAYAYLCKDLNMMHELERKLVERAEDDGMSSEEIYDVLQSQGIFIIISTRKIAKESLLELYYTRDQVEKLFKISKQNSKILPINIETEETLRGHLMITFMATALLKLMSDKLKKTSLTTDSMFMNLHEQHANIYENELITTEPTKKMNDAYKAFKITCPVSIPLKGGAVVDPKTNGN